MSLHSVFTVILAALAVTPSMAQEPPEARVVPFFDLWKLDAWDNVELRQGEPTWVRECEYRDPSVAGRGVYFPSVWIDEETGKWRLVYSVKWSPLTMMAAESEDGISWKPLPVEDADVGDGEKLAPNHLLTVPGGSGGGIYHDPRATGGYPFRIFGRQQGAPVFQRALADPDHRWHRVATEEGEKRYIGEGITLVSKDGLHWELKTGGPWDWNDEDWFPEPPVFAFWNAHTKRHVMAARPGWGDRRQCLRTTTDFETWSDPELQFQPDPLDTDGPIGMYGLPVAPVGKGAGFVGLLWIFHNASSEPVKSFNQFFGTMDAQLVYSYDGVRFVRGMREPFLKLNPIAEPGCTQIRPCSIVEAGDRIHIYSEGHRGAHGRERSEQGQTEEPLSSLMLHTLRKDGWMYLASKGDWARIQTKPFALFSPEIRINAAAKYGEVRFQVTDEKSEPLEGFTFEDCVPMRGVDSVSHVLKWKDGSDLKALIDRPLRLEVKFRQAKLYAFEMAHHFLDAHDLWWLKDGKKLEPQRRFDF
jgi:hypothetical protein